MLRFARSSLPRSGRRDAPASAYASHPRHGSSHPQHAADRAGRRRRRCWIHCRIVRELREPYVYDEYVIVRPRRPTIRTSLRSRSSRSASGVSRPRHSCAPPWWPFSSFGRPSADKRRHDAAAIPRSPERRDPRRRRSGKAAALLAAREAIYSVRRDVEPRGDLQPTQPSLTRSRSVPVRFQSCAWPAPCSLAPGLCPPARPGPSK
jgi:hypothetical protein